VLIDGSARDNRIRSAMGNQDRRADLRQEIVVMEEPREQSLTDIRRDGDIVAQHQEQLAGRGRRGETQP